MIKEEKYYTPQVEEFHVGFEYQYLHTDKDWINFVFGGVDDTCVLEKQRELDKNKIRVKYLDKKDIDSLIDEVDKLRETIEFYENYVYEFSFNKSGSNYTGLYTYSDNMISFYETDLGNSCIFRGTIRNKSELKRLLDQLNII